MRRWLARLSFSFLILAGLLLFQAYREWTYLHAPNPSRIALYCIAAGISIGLAVQGMRERHRSNDRED